MSKKDSATDAVAGQPFVDEERKTIVAPDGASSTFGVSEAADGEDQPENVQTIIVDNSAKLSKKEQQAIFEAAGSPDPFAGPEKQPEPEPEQELPVGGDH